MHIAIDEYNRFKELEHEIVARGGFTYRESHNGDGGTAHDDHHIRRFLAGGIMEFKDVKLMTLEEMQHEEEVLHSDMVHEFSLI